MLKIQENKKYRLCAIIMSFLLLFCLFPLSACSEQQQKDVVLHVLNVGNADCIALELPDGKKALIDCGLDLKSPNSYKTNALNYLKTKVFNGKINGTFDFLVLTHPHEDHDKLAPEIFEYFNIKKVYRPAVFYYNTSNSELTQKELQKAKEAGFVGEDVTDLKTDRTVATCDTKHYAKFLEGMYNEKSEIFYTFSENGVVIENEEVGYRLDFYAPYKLSYGTSDLNKYSPIMILTYKNHSIALTGDAVTETETYVAEHNELPKVDLLKVAHHGSSGASSSVFLDEIRPNYAFFSVSDNNSYGHPTDEAIQRILDCGVLEEHMLMTKDNGDLVFTIFENANIEVRASDGTIIVENEEEKVNITTILSFNIHFLDENRQKSYYL